MKTKSVSLVFLALAATVPAFAQDKSASTNVVSASAAPTASAGLLNDWLRQQSAEFKRWDIGGQLRLRYESRGNMAVAGRAGAVDFGASPVDNENDFFLTREKIHLGFTPVNWLTVFGEARHSSAAGDERTPSPDRDAIDLHQAFITLGNVKTFPLTAKIGRQELSYGDERLIGASDWGNTGRVFDAAKVRYENSDLWVDAFISHPVMVHDGYFNENNNHDYFSGIYASTKKIPKQTTEAYFLARNTSPGSTKTLTSSTPAGGASPRDIYTFGVRMKSTPGDWGNWDYMGEFMGQFGHFNDPLAPVKSLEHRAYAVFVGGGYTWTQLAYAPRVGLEYNFGSGDGNPTDTKHGTFENLFPTNHKFYGFMDLFSLQNIHNVRLTSSIKPVPRLTLTFDYHAFWLANTRDNLYTVAGARRGGIVTTPTQVGYGINPTYGSYVGSEIDLTATYAIKGYATAQLGYGHFFVGDYIKQSLSAATVGSTDANWIYAQLNFSF